MKRRDFLKSSIALVITTPFAQSWAAAPKAKLVPTLDGNTGLPLLRLPEGFSYSSFGWTGDLMQDGYPTPPRHDGMALMSKGGESILLRNHEMLGHNRLSAETPVYDNFSLPAGVHNGYPNGIDAFCGGVSGVFVSGKEQGTTVHLLTGTMVNCAGGPTPWGSWLTCEEIVWRGSRMGLKDQANPKDHGYVFEVPAPHLGRASANPIIGMGLMKHEAAAVDPRTGFVYLTEDNSPSSGFYRYLPENTKPGVGNLEQGGRLQMLRVREQPNAELIQRKRGESFEVDWVDIADPDQDPESLIPSNEHLPPMLGAGKSGPYLQGEEQGAARFARLEGAWYHEGLIYFTDTAGGSVGEGTIWTYDPSSDSLTLLFDSPSGVVANSIDNITLSPTGMIVICEDGSTKDPDTKALLIGARLVIVNRDGTTRILAENNMKLDAPVPGKRAIKPADYRSVEWAGATFSDDGKTLYVNIQVPGVTFAITGPWFG